MQRTTTRRLAGLDPEREYQEIVFLLQCQEFPWDYERSLEFALFRTYASPSISGLLCRTGEFIRRPRKRYDDTELLLYEITENGFDSARGQAALERINQMHGRFPIANEDFVYVLSTFIFEPIRWLERFGWRSLRDNEKQGLYCFYRELGRRMHITDIPDDLDKFERFNRDYERRRFLYAESNHRIGAATRDLLLGFYLPAWLWPLGEPLVNALMDDPLLDAFGFARPPKWLKKAVQYALRWRGTLLRYFPERRHPRLGTRVKRPTYPAGYRIENLGTFAGQPRAEENPDDSKAPPANHSR